MIGLSYDVALDRVNQALLGLDSVQPGHERDALKAALNEHVENALRWGLRDRAHVLATLLGYVTTGETPEAACPKLAA